ncbi:MAG TPA: lactate utilization protein B, partial [Bacillota bacterium]|nr:lactate utilization protein B [Bacillota bacterium]
MPIAHEPQTTFAERVTIALDDIRLRENITRSTTRFAAQRLAALGQLEDAPGLKARGRAIRADAIARLDELHEQLRQNIESRGGHVHRAAEPSAVTRLVVEIARAHGARRVVKSKSMVSEEVALNDALAEAGIESLETDLGEYIIQLAGEMPAHLIAPALHKSRAEAAELLGAPADTEAEALTALARARLRERFLAADIGITGGNFLVADTGGVVIVTNEGNDRMCTSLPRVHIAIVGVEKIIAHAADLPDMLCLLTRSATGQKISVYVSLIDGPRQAGETDGPEEFHLILLDNGRTRLRGTSHEEVLYCIRCGACLNVCPVYRQIGGHAYGSVYPGPIGAVLSPLLDPAFAVLPKASSLCGACWEACPVGIHLHDQLVELRQEGAAKAPRSQRLLFAGWAAAWSSAAAYNAFFRVGRALQGVLPHHGGWISRAPSLLGGWTSSRDLPPIAGRTFR